MTTFRWAVGSVVWLAMAAGIAFGDGKERLLISPKVQTKTFTYKKTPQADLKLYVHCPPGWKPTDRRPAMVFFFGGGWKHGSVHQFEPQAGYFATRGMVTVRADYRVSSRHKVTPDQCVEDAKSAVRWVRQHASELGVDPDRIAAAGGSAGGHLAACVGLTDGPETDGEDRSISSRAQVLVLYNPVLDMTIEKIVKNHLGGDEKLARQISPQHNLRKDGPPTLILFGTKDRLGTLAPAYLAKARELGNRVELYEAQGQDHGFFNKRPWLERTTRRVDEFLVSVGYLKGEPAAPTKPITTRTSTSSTAPSTRPRSKS